MRVLVGDGLNLFLKVNMNNIDEDQKSSTSSHARDHMANERTFLAWIRTSIGIMAFGFVVEKFALFIKQIALLLGKSHSQMSARYFSFSSRILFNFRSISCSSWCANMPACLYQI